MIDYKSSGVDISAGEEAVHRIKPLVRNTFNKNVLSDLGHFGGLYQIDLSVWKSPVVVCSTDGVGTKIKIAIEAGVFNTIGQDIVNHCIDDILVQGAIPQIFLDYIGVGKLIPEQIEKIISGMTIACLENNCALIGGEMAEMPGLYHSDDLDIVGTIMGLVEKDALITGENIKDGDIVIGLYSNGLHTNGFSLARRALFEIGNYRIDQYIDELGCSLTEALLTPHTSYLSIIKPLLSKNGLHGMAHITGGGIVGNLSRVIPDSLTAEIYTKSWKIPQIFGLIQNSGNIEEAEMRKVFNMGIGMILVVDENLVSEILTQNDAVIIGSVRKKSQISKNKVFYR